MAGPKLRKPQMGDAGPVRDAKSSGAPSHVSVGVYSKTTEIVDVGRGSRNSFESRRVLSDRPSTSGGLPSRKPNGRRESKDDLHIFPLRANPFGTTYYNFPLPASSSTPGTASIPSPPRTYSPAFGKPEVNDLNYTCTEVGIGMAIGSPTQLPAAWSPQVQFRNSPNQNFSPELLDDWGVPSRTKSSRWRLLGGLFGKKGANHDATEVQAFNHDNYLNFPLPPPEKVRGRGKTTSERRSKQHKPDVRRANTMPTDFNFQTLGRPKEFPMITDEQKQPMRSLLDVDIPSIQMERYSVMFGNVIKPPSLLARRQANLERLKTVEELSGLEGFNRKNVTATRGESDSIGTEIQPRPRRGTSPLPTKSPAMSLFPTISRTQRDQPMPMPRRSPLHRSNTSPAALSPNRQTFLPPKPISKHLDAPSARLSRPWSSDVPVPPDSPSSISSAEVQSTPLKPAPQFTEPAWKMVQPNPNKSKRHPNPPQVQFNAIQRNQSVMISSPLHTLPRKQSLQSSLDTLAARADEAEEMINTAANISIARQISVSRRQKQMLVPIKARMNGRSPIVEDTIQAVARVNERKPMTPTLVNVVSGRIERGEQAILVRA